MYLVYLHLYVLFAFKVLISFIIETIEAIESRLSSD